MVLWELAKGVGTLVVVNRECLGFWVVHHHGRRLMFADCDKGFVGWGFEAYVDCCLYEFVVGGRLLA